MHLERVLKFGTSAWNLRDRNLDL